MNKTLQQFHLRIHLYIATFVRYFGVIHAIMTAYKGNYGAINSNLATCPHFKTTLTSYNPMDYTHNHANHS